MKYGFIIPFGDVRTIPKLAESVEAAGWDAVFIPDCFGTMLTPLSRRRPWKVARETVTLDHLSNGRLILPVGLGAAGDDAGFYKVGEVMERKTRAKLLDESLEIITGLWSGQPLYY